MSEEKKPSSWVPERCYGCDQSGKCKRCVFYSGKKLSAKSEGAILRTRYGRIQQHEIFLCRNCATRGWRKVFFVEVLRSGGGLIFSVGFLIALLLFPVGETKTAQYVILGIPALMILGFLFWFLADLRNLLKPTFKSNIMADVAIALARSEIASDTGADGFFTKSDLRGMQQD